MSDRPSKETLEMWMSAHLDGELGETEQELLFAELEHNPELGEHLGQMAAFAALPADAVFAPPKLSEGYGPGGSVDFGDALTDSVMVATRPELVSNTTNGAAQLCSAFIDGELNAEGANRFKDTVKRSNTTASAILGMVHTSEAVSIALSHSHESPFVLEATESVLAKVESALARDARAELLFSASL